MLTKSHKIYSFVKEFLKEEDGPTAVEYAVMLGLIVMACAGSILTLGTATRDSVFDSATQIITAFSN